jgi:hypothetical protein
MGIIIRRVLVEEAHDYAESPNSSSDCFPFDLKVCPDLSDIVMSS